jgi:hypothetical protein
MLYATALTRLGQMTAATVEPLLTAPELADLLVQARRADTLGTAPDVYLPWAPSTAYALGATVVPTTRNGHAYTVTTAGASGAMEPPWPTTSGATVADGTAVFTEAGSAVWVATYDLNAAAAEGWRRKAAKVSAEFTFSTGQQSFTRRDKFELCQQMVREYQRKIGQVVTLTGDWPRTWPWDDWTEPACALGN